MMGVTNESAGGASYTQLGGTGWTGVIAGGLGGVLGYALANQNTKVVEMVSASTLSTTKQIGELGLFLLNGQKDIALQLARLEGRIDLHSANIQNTAVSGSQNVIGNQNAIVNQNLRDDKIMQHIHSKSLESVIVGNNNSTTGVIA